jgi:signal transduction histidine kinase/ActR/RegA family two-component response regulator
VASRSSRLPVMAAARPGRIRQWWLDQPVRTKGMIAVAFPLIALVAVTVASLMLQYNERQERSVAMAASRLSTAAEQTLADVVNAETSIRGYAATGRAEFLAPYNLARKSLPADLATLRTDAIAEGDIRQERAVAATTAAVMADLARIRAEISTGGTGGTGKALTPALEAGKVRMDLLRRRVASLAEKPANIVSTGRTEITRMESAIGTLSYAGLAVGLLAGLISVVLFTSGISRRVAAAARNADRLGEGQPLEPMPGAGDEIGRLARSLVRAQGLLDTRTAELTGARDEALQATQAKNAFLSSTSHELRTPLNAVLGFTQLLQLSDLSAEDRDGVERILAAGRHLLSLINELIDIARIESGEFSLSVEPVLVPLVVEEACQLMAPLAAERSVVLTHECSHPELAVLADRQRLSQILVNLLSNAIKYNRYGGRVTITCRAHDQEQATIVVADTGAGLSEADLRRIFVPFDRLGAEQTGIEGTGIGLPLARAFAVAMKGELDVASTLGKGTAFTVTLPRAADMAQVPQEDSTALTGLDAPPRPSGAQARILYIEDNPANVEVVSRYLRSRPNVRLHSVMTGQAGLDLAQQEIPDLILLDLHLPDMQGGEVLKRLKAEPATAGIPVAVLSAEAAPAVIRSMRDSGVVAYLTKPLNLTEVGRVVDCLTAKQSQRSGQPPRTTPAR